MNFIQRYAPNNDNNDDDENQFYEKLQSIIKKGSGNDLIIMIRNLSAKVRMDNTEYEDIMRQYELTERKRE